MDARSSRYPDVYARWQHDPEGFWGEAAVWLLKYFSTSARGIFLPFTLAAAP